MIESNRSRRAPDGPEGWGRLNLFAAADDYGSFDRDVVVSLPGAGCGGLVKTCPGTLTLTGGNPYRGGTTIAGGTLVAASSRALGRGDLVAGAGGGLAVSRRA